MINKSLYLRILMVCLFYICSGQIRAVAAIEPYQHMLQGKIKKGDTLIVKDEKFRNSAYDWSLIRNKTVDNMIVFGFYTDVTPLPRKNFKCKIDLKIEYWSQPDQIDPVTEDHVELEISYDTATGAVYQAEKAYHFKNGHRVKITVNDITSAELGEELPDVFRLLNMVTIDRQYLADPANTQQNKPYIIPSAPPSSGNGMMLMQINPPEEANGEVTIGWPADPVADEYDLDWTFIDAESEYGALLATYQATPPNTVLENMFRNNFTRVTVEGHQYPVSLVHQSKYLLVRLRTVSYETGGFRNERAWEYLVHELTNTWHEPGKNWQYNATYAEEGKKKEVVSYADGTLRTRQSVTVSNPGASVHLNTQKYAVVQESIYDEFGRPVVSVLPAPIKASELKYYPLMNLNAGGTPYNFFNMYGAAGNCISKPEQMFSSSDVNQTSRGAATYYSADNPFRNDAFTNNKYIPDAQKYPFAVTRYTPDNTGRVMVQGGVGETFQPGPEGKATRYFYGKPEQWELDRLFGNDAGFAEHYLKNMTIDPNGQISISYVNASGKTVATALTGPTPDNVKPLASQPVVSTKTSVLLKPSQFRFDHARLTLSATANYMVSLEGPFQVNYNIDQFISRYTSANVDICSNCYYTLKITVSDDCGNRQEIAAPSFVGSKLSNCNVNLPSTGNFTYTPQTLGTHYIRFELGLSEEVIGAYTDDFISRNTDLKTEFQFLLEQLNAMNFKDCISDCSTCLGTLGEKTVFINRVRAQLAHNSMNVSGSNGTAIDSWSGGLYDVLLAHCQSIRQQCSLSPCEENRRLMLKDVSPGGQYALFTQAGSPIEPSINVIYSKWRTVFPVYPSSDTRYKQEQFELEDGTITSPHDIDFQLKTLLDYWNPAWAERFLQYHPEQCALAFCETNSQYLAWDEKAKTEIQTAAQIPQLQSGLQYSQQSDWLVNADPFFKSGGAGYSQATAFRNELMNYSSTVITQTHTVKGLTGFVDYVLYCADEFGNINTSTAEDKWANCTPAANCRVPDREWRLYREKYFALKAKYYQSLRNTTCSTACKPGKPVTVVTSSCPPASMFSITSGGPLSNDPSLQSIVIKYHGAAVSEAVTLKLSFPQGYEGLASEIHTTLNTLYNATWPSTLNVNDVRIRSVECPPAPVTAEQCNGIAGSLSLTATGKRTGEYSFEETVNGVVRKYFLVRGYSDEQPDVAPYCAGGTAVFRNCYKVYMSGSTTPISYYNVWVISCGVGPCVNTGTYNMELSFGGGKYYGNGNYYFFNATPDCSPSSTLTTHDCATVTVGGTTENYTNVTVKVCEACSGSSQSLAPTSVESQTATTGIYVLAGYRYYVYGNTTDPSGYNPSGCTNAVKSWYNCFTVTHNGTSKVFYNASVVRCTIGANPCENPAAFFIYDRMESANGDVYYRDIRDGGNTVCYYYVDQSAISCSTDPHEALYFPNGDGCVAFLDGTTTWIHSNVTIVYECCGSSGGPGPLNAMQAQQVAAPDTAVLQSTTPSSGIQEVVSYNDGQIYLIKSDTTEPAQVEGATGWQFKDHYALRTGRNIYRNFSGVWVARKVEQSTAGTIESGLIMSIMSGASVECPISPTDFTVIQDHSAPPDIFKYSLQYTGSYQIPAGVSLYVTLIFQFNPTTYYESFEFNSTNYTTPIPGGEFNESNHLFYGLHIYFSCVDNGTPPTGCDPLYATKTPRFNDVILDPTETADLPQLHAEGRANFQQHLNSSCESNVDTWLQQMEECLAAYPDYQTKKAALRAGLIAVCKRGGDLDHIDGASTTPPGTTTTVGNYTSFGDVIKQVMGISSFSMTCNPWLIDGPYPYKVKRQATNTVVNKTSPEICTALNKLVTDHASSGTGGTVFNYLQNRFGDGMNITSAELDMLLKGCNNCKYLLEKDMKLPVFLDPGATGCVTAQQYNAAKAAFATALGGSPNPQHANYQRAFATYMNHQWGFTMGYDEYEAYEASLTASPNAMLCNKPAFGETPADDPLSCIMTLVNDAVHTARYQYAAYIDKERKLFRDKYIRTCSSTRAQATLQAPQQIYHYTLYYYDQAGQLIRTVPPQGVVPLTDAEVEKVAYAREYTSTADCEYAGPASASTTTQVADGMNSLLSGTDGAMEFWLKAPTSGPVQVLFTSAGTRRYLYNACIGGNYMNVDIYELVPAVSGTAVDIVHSYHTAVDITPVQPLREFVHVVIQGNDLTAHNLQVFVNGVACANAPNAPVSICGWQIGFNGQVLQYPENYAAVQHIRLYNGPLPQSDIAKLASNTCMANVGLGGNVARTEWYRFNVQAGSTGSGLEASPVYPIHAMTTSYAYNTLGQVVQQKTPDAGISKFWYDYLGRLILSQNAEQLAPAEAGAASNRFSYTTYDQLGRITEVGEALNLAAIPQKPFLQQAEYNTVMANTTRQQITRTYYDARQPWITQTLDNLRKRVVATVYEETAGIPQQSTYYSYDQLGNVKSLWQSISGLPTKQIEYNYDLASGKVNAVRYQAGGMEQFMYRYKYDAENRLVEVSNGYGTTGEDNWEIEYGKRQAVYQYYPHGPLSRIELGELNIQGIDYAYTLQGWLKGINGQFLDPSKDMGGDGSTRPTFAKDVMAYSLNYFPGDYQQVGTGVNTFALQFDPNGNFDGKPLYNGNISAITTALSQFRSGAPVGYSYTYDQLNRLVQMRQQDLASNATTWQPRTSGNIPYKEDITYDGNGNILTYKRNGSRTDVDDVMDNLAYTYANNGGNPTNRLLSVQDASTNASYSTDFKGTNGYTYDKIGNLMSETPNGASSIKWTVYGKIRSIVPTGGGSLSYRYDAGGNRVYKLYNKPGGGTVETWYVRDAQGNPLATYTKENGATEWSEQHLYGSSRLGLWKPGLNVTAPVEEAETKWLAEGGKRYELTNHLGNVMAVLSDKRLGGPVYTAEVVGMQDYYPFGMLMVGRSLGAGGYRYGFGSKENDNEVKGEGNQVAFEARTYDPRIGKFLSIDPLTQDYPNQSPYVYAANSPIRFVDVLGMGPGPSFIGAWVSKVLKDFPFFTETGKRNAKLVENAVMPSVLATGNGLVRTLSAGTINRTAEDIGLNEEHTEAYNRSSYAAASVPSPFTFPTGGTGSAPSLALAGSAKISIDVVKPFATALNMPALRFANSAPADGGEDASSSTGDNSNSQNQAKVLPNQNHHYATNKHSFYTPQMEKIAKGLGLNLNAPWNIESLPHLGRHPNKYHNFVLKGMQAAETEANGNVSTFLKLFEEYVKKPVRENPQLLRKSGH